MNTHLSTGGKAAGADEEDWWRQLERNFDPETGKKTSEEVFRLAGSRMEPVRLFFYTSLAGFDVSRCFMGADSWLEAKTWCHALFGMGLNGRENVL